MRPRARGVVLPAAAAAPRAARPVRAAHDAGATTSLDTNWDPSGAWAGLSEVLPLVDVLLVNAAELRALAAVALGRPVDELGEAAAAFTAYGTIVALKDGADGGRVWTAGGEWHQPGLPVRLADAVGAGDSFDAGFLAGLAEGLPPARGAALGGRLRQPQRAGGRRYGCAAVARRAARGGALLALARSSPRRGLRVGQLARREPAGSVRRRRRPRPSPHAPARGSGAGRPGPASSARRARTAPVKATLSAVPMLTLTMPAATAADSVRAGTPGRTVQHQRNRHGRAQSGDQVEVEDGGLRRSSRASCRRRRRGRRRRWPRRRPRPRRDRYGRRARGRRAEVRRPCRRPGPARPRPRARAARPRRRCAG